MELISTVIGTVAFALLFGVTKNYYLSCGLIVAAGWLMYRLMMWTGMGATFAVFFATVVIVLLSRFADGEAYWGCKCSGVHKDSKQNQSGMIHHFSCRERQHSPKL